MHLAWSIYKISFQQWQSPSLYLLIIFIGKQLQDGLMSFLSEMLFFVFSIMVLE